MHVGFGNLQVIPEDVIEADLQRSDPGTRTLPHLDLRQIGFAVARDVAQFVEPRIKTIADRSAVGQVHRQFVGKSRQDAVADFNNFVQTLVNISQARGTRPSQPLLQRRYDA